MKPGGKEFNRAWLAAVLLLAIGLVCTQAVVRSLNIALAKQPVPLRRPFTEMARSNADYQMIEEVTEFPPAVVKIMNADGVITRVYHDTRLGLNEPGGRIRLHLAYYTGRTDVYVGHRPDVCYVAAGAEAGGLSQTMLPLGDFDPAELPVSLFRFRVPRSGFYDGVVFFFVANGRFTGTTTGVRLLDLRLNEKKAYWCKVEIHPVGLTSQPLIYGSAARFIRFLLPELMRCLPAWPPED